MSLIRLLLGGMFVFITFAPAAFAQIASAKIALVNTDAFYDEKTGIAKLVTANKQLESEFAVRVKALQEGGAKLQSIAQEMESLRKLPAAQFNQTAYNTKQEEGERLDRDLKYQKTELEDAVAKRRKVLIAPISADIGSAITEFGKKNGFGAILDVSKMADSGVLLFFQESGDLTKDFILFYNARKASVAPPK